MAGSGPNGDAAGGADAPAAGHRTPLLAEVAQRSGVSLATASRVLNPDSTYPVSAVTRARVVAAAEELRYQSNALARGFKLQRTNTVAVIVHDIRDPYFNESARGVTDAAGAAGYLSMICNSDRDPEIELQYVDMVQQHRVAGVLFVGGGFVSRSYRSRMSRHIAAIQAYGGHAIALGPRADKIPGEVPDNRGGARMATEHLLGLGHERIALVDGPATLRTSVERVAGYRDALEAAGHELRPELLCDGGYSVAGGAAAMRQLLDRPDAFTAVFATNDAMAIGCMQEIARDGLTIPGDLSLIGFDDVPLVQWLAPPLTTIRVPMYEIGAAGVRRLLTLLEDGDEDGPRTVVHPGELVVRGSTAPPG